MSKADKVRLLRQDEPYGLVRIVEILANAGDHLLRDHDCDRHAWETVEGALSAARDWLAFMSGSARTSAPLRTVTAIVAGVAFETEVEFDVPAELTDDQALEHPNADAAINEAITGYVDSYIPDAQ